MSAASRSPEIDRHVRRPDDFHVDDGEREFCTRIPVPRGVAESPTIREPRYLGSRQFRGDDRCVALGRRQRRKAQRDTASDPADQRGCDHAARAAHRYSPGSTITSDPGRRAAIAAMIDSVGLTICSSSDDWLDSARAGRKRPGPRHSAEHETQDHGEDDHRHEAQRPEPAIGSRPERGNGAECSHRHTTVVLAARVLRRATGGTSHLPRITGASL